MVKVGDGEHDAATSYGVGFTVHGIAEFALVFGTVQDGRSDFGESVGRVFGIVTGHGFFFSWYTTLNSKSLDAEE